MAVGTSQTVTAGHPTMRTEQGRSMLRATTFGLIVLAAGGAMAQPASPPDGAKAAPVAMDTSKAAISTDKAQLGDRWVYELRDEITGTIKATRTQVITALTPNEIRVQFTSTALPKEGTFVYDRSWNLLTNTPWKYLPSDGTGVQAPLAVGKTWSFRADEVNSTTGAMLKRSGTSKILGQETVTTRAGTFETFKIETSYSRVSTKDPSRKVEITATGWYAPSISHWVKRNTVTRSEHLLRDKGSVELVEYRHKD
ncbi:MAG TPA: hypothetical protein VMM15_05310 [Bradyrhizobium sp.]|nr:hypothetical protein [Bradyrhizobium sp.]